MSHYQGNDKIYEELRGYFPPEYDLTPDELEKEIETENKKREIALGMMRAHLSESKDGAKDVFVPKSKILSTEMQKKVPSAPVPTVKPEPVPEPTVEESAIAPDESIEDDIIAPPTDTFVTEIMSDVADADDLDEGVSAEEDHIEDVLEASPAETRPEEETDEFNYDNLDDLFDLMEKDEGNSYEEGETVTADSLNESRKNVSWFFDLLEVFAVCITCIIVIFAIFFRLTKVSGESMEDTLFENEYLVVSDFMYEPKTGDIVVIQNTALADELLREPLVKRVIAVGGQSVDISPTGVVTVTDKDGNTTVLDQPYIKNESYRGASGHYDVPEGHVFVMGDNRNNSTDSRSQRVGVIDERCIFGKALVRILPFSEFTVFENPYNE